MNGILLSYNCIIPQRQSNSIGFGSQIKKLGEKFLNGNRNLTGEDAATVLQKLGYTLDRTTASHHLFKGENGDTVNISIHGLKKVIKHYQIKDVAEAIEKAGGLSVLA